MTMAHPEEAQVPPVDVCIIEDDGMIQELVNQILEDVGIHAETCPLGWNAHRWIRERCPKVVILDVQMPEVDGIQLFYLLRADPRTHTIRVIFLTANPQKVLQELPNYGEMGAEILPKPFVIDDLLKIVRQDLDA